MRKLERRNSVLIENIRNRIDKTNNEKSSESDEEKIEKIEKIEDESSKTLPSKMKRGMSFSEVSFMKKNSKEEIERSSPIPIKETKKEKKKSFVSSLPEIKFKKSPITGGFSLQIRKKPEIQLSGRKVLNKDLEQLYKNSILKSANLIFKKLEPLYKKIGKGALIFDSIDLTVLQSINELDFSLFYFPEDKLDSQTLKDYAKIYDPLEQFIISIRHPIEYNSRSQYSTFRNPNNNGKLVQFEQIVWRYNKATKII